MKIKLTAEQIKTIATFIENGKKIDAIKEIRNILRCDLFRAKKIIEEYFVGPAIYPGQIASEDDINRFHANADKFIHAMKHREFLNYGELPEVLNDLILTYGVKTVLKHVVTVMEDDE